MREFSGFVGRVAVSKAGRDKGRAFVILELADKDHVLIADGKLRKLEKPKRKSLCTFAQSRCCLKASPGFMPKAG